MTENEAIDLDKLIEDAKVLAKEKDTLARTFRNFKDYGNPKSTITSGAEKAQKEAEQYEHISKLFEELKAYRAIGTIEEFKALKEKSMARKPLPKGTHKGIDNFYCPNCNHPLTNRHEQCELPYCDICGQRLDWGEEESMKEFIEKLIGRLEETDFNDIQMVVREVLLKYGFPYESVVQDEVWNALDELSTNKVAIKIVNQLAEEYNNGWVPCSERLPEKKGDYLVTCNDGKVRVWWFVVADDFKCWLEGVGNLKPIAWMPLPEPYKESEE